MSIIFLYYLYIVVKQTSPTRDAGCDTLRVKERRSVATEVKQKGSPRGLE